MSSLFGTSASLAQYPILNQAYSLLYAARTEIILFFLAFALHHLLFGKAFYPGGSWGWKKSKRVSSSGGDDRRARGRRIEEDDREEVIAASTSDPSQALCQSQDAYERGDHRTVLRLWNTLRRCDQVPAAHLAQVLESMQRFKKDSNMILGEVQNYLNRNQSVCDITYINKLLEPLAKSLDTEVVDGLFEYLPSMRLSADSVTYEILIQMYFTTRSFDQVRELSKEMTLQKVPATSKTSLVMLKTALSLGKLDDAIRWYKEVTSTTSKLPSISQAPRHLSVQLAELACREHRLELVLEELESGRMCLSPDMLNAMLNECLRSKDRKQIDRLDRLVANSQVEKSARTFHLLVKMASGDRIRISKLLDEMIQSRTECTQEVATAVLSTASTLKDVTLADKLYAHMGSDKNVQIPVLLQFIRFFADVGQHEKACNVYEEHLQSRGVALGDENRRPSLMDARTERMLLSSAFQCGRQGISSSLVEATPSDTAKHISLIRASAGRGDLEDAMRIFSALEASGADLTNSLYNTALDACVECRDLRRAEKLMQRMEASNLADAVSYNTLIKAYLTVEGYDKARALMTKMQAKGLAPNHVTYNEMINALVRSDKDSRRSMVWDVVDEMKKAGVQPNRITCSILLKNLNAKSPQANIMRTMELTTAMQEPMDEVLLSSVVEACVRIGRPNLLAQKLEQLVGKSGITITGAHTFGSLIKAYGCAKDVAGAWRCWKEMRSQHIKPTSITIGCMVEAVVANGDVDGGYELLSQLLEDEQCKDQVNSVVFGSVIKGYGRSRRMERLWSVFKEMLSKGIEPSVVTFNAIIDACARNGNMDQLPWLRQEMKSRNLSPNLITYSTMIKGFCQRQDMPSALRTLEDLRQTHGLRPDEIVYNTLLEGCSSAGLLVEGERLLSEMRSDGISPSNYTLTVMVRLLGHARRLDRAVELVEDITHRHRFRPNSHVNSALVQACIASRDLKRASTIFEKAVQDRALPDSRTCQNFVKSLLTNGNSAQAVSVLRAMLSSGGAPQQGNRNGNDNKYNNNDAAPDDSFFNEALGLLLERGGESATLVPQLLDEIRATKPRLRIDNNIQRRLTAFGLS
jgi:pentatricopeptide repeat protein